MRKGQVLQYYMTLLTIAFLAVAIMFAGTGFAGNSSQVPPAVEMVVDQATGSFQFLIDGREVARISESGLHVRGSIEYGGTIVDIGGDHYDLRVQPVAPADAD